MITPEFLEGLEYSKLVMIYSNLNIKLTEIIIAEILKNKELNSYTKNQLKVLIQTGGKEIFEKALEETSSFIEGVVVPVFVDVLEAVSLSVTPPSSITATFQW